MKLSVRGHLVLLTLAVVGPVLVFGGILLHHYAEATRQTFRHEARAAVHALTDDLDQWLGSWRTSLQLLATSPYLEKGDFTAFHAQAAELLRQESLHVVLRDMAGQQVVNTRLPFGAPLPQVAGFEADEEAARTREPVVSNLFIGAVAQRPLIVINVPVIFNGQVAYLLNLSVPVERIWSILAQQRLGPDWITGMADRNGVVLARSRYPEDFVGKRLPPEVLARIGQNEAGWYEFINLDGVASLNAYGRSRVSGWLVAVSIPVSAIEAPLVEGLAMLVQTGGLLLLVSLVLAYFVGGRLAGALNALAIMATAVGRGGAVAPLATPVREVDLVSRELARSAGQVAQRTTELGDLNATLELKVEERARDILRTQTRLRESEQRFQAIFDSMFQFIGLLVPDGTLLEANRTALDFGGLTQGHVIGKPFWETRWWMADAETQKRLRKAIRDAASGRFVRYEVEVLGAGDIRAVIDFSLKPVAGDDGAVVLLVAEGRDITERKRVEAQLLQAQKMESIGLLTGGIAHDFNNLLQAIGINLSVARLLAGGDEALRVLDRAQQAVDRGGSLTRQLVAFARRQSLRPEPVDLADLLKGINDLLARTTGGLIDLTITPSPEAGAALVDRTQLEMAVLNLAINARDAMPEGGRLTITTSAVEIAEDDIDRPVELPPGGYVVLRVIDTGTGMPPEVVERAFEPFFTTKEVGRGSGLGLSMVHGMVGQLGGAVRIDSQLGKGTAVELYLPRARAAVPVPAPKEIQAMSGAAFSILLVDDDPLVREGMSALLRGLGHRVIEAPSGREALDVLRHEDRIDLLLTDYAMPEMNGGELARVAAALRPGLPVLLLTGYNDMPDQDGVTAILGKPFTPAQLIRALTALAPPPPVGGNIVSLRPPGRA